MSQIAKVGEEPADDPVRPLASLRPAPPRGSMAAASGQRMVVTEVTALTGVSRERLRTWERRHGFPQPERLRSGVRTYAMADIPLIVTVSRLIESGYPVADAIAATLAPAPSAVGVDPDGTSLDRAPMPAIALAGASVETLEIVWTNLATQLQPAAFGGGPAAPPVPSRLGDPALAEIAEMLADRGSVHPTRLLDHVDWIATFPVACRSLCWRTETDAGPTVVLLQIPHLVSESRGLVPTDREAAVWAAGVGAARVVLQREGGLASAQHALRELAQSVHAFDGMLVLGHHHELRTASSVRGMVPARAVDERHCRDLWDAVQHGGEVRWLGPDAAEAFGLPSYLVFLAMPLGIGGTQIGAAVLCFSERFALSELVSELVQVFCAAMAAVVQRERSLRPTLRPPSGSSDARVPDAR